MEGTRLMNYAAKIVFGVMILFPLVTYSAIEITPPKYEVIDRNDVNVASGQVSPKLTDVSIGGSLGLTHSISTYSSNFGNYEPGKWGYEDSFRGGLISIIHTPRGAGGMPADFWVLRAFGGGFSADFRINGNGTYTAVKDTRETLEFVAGLGYKYTTVNGTVLTYPKPIVFNSSNGTGSFRSLLQDIVYPNGFKITIHKKDGASWDSGIMSVNTNTGYQLKYVYERHNRPLEAAKQSAKNNPNVPVESATWSSLMPRHIKAINNAVEYCDKIADDCTVYENWPTVTYTWPDGMPRAFYIGDSIFTVKDAMGRVTEYKHRAYDTYIGTPGTGDWGKPGEYYVPRLIQIKDAKSNKVRMNYDYENKGDLADGSTTNGWPGMPRWISTGDAVLKRAYTADYSLNYAIGEKHIQYNTLIKVINGGGNGYKEIKYVYINVGYQVPTDISTWEATVKLEGSYTNRVQSIYKTLGKGTISFKYDSRSNLNWRSENGIITEAGFDATCSNRKTCNQPNWVSDGMGNKTFYTYHPQSGQVLTVTQPANAQGIQPQTRYSYEQKYASYKINGNTITKDSSGIWLPSRESYCINSNYNGSACQGNDEVVTSYEYESSNLSLVGVAVSAQGTTLRTCYKYDKYGNRIGETQPAANLTTCL